MASTDAFLEKQKVKTDYEIERVQKSVAFLRSGLQEPDYKG